MSFCLSASLQLTTLSKRHWRVSFLSKFGTTPHYPLYTCRLQDKDWLCQHRQHTAQLASTSRRGPQIGQGRFDSCASSSSFLQWQGQDGDALGGGWSGLIHRDFLITPEARDRPSDKLRPRWYGPFKVLEKVSSNAFRLDLPFQLWCHPVFNVSALKYNKIVHEGRTVEPPPPITDLDGFQHYIVKKILSHCRRRGKLQYLVKWIGYNDATWEPEHFLKNEAGQDLDPLKRYKEMNPHWLSCLRTPAIVQILLDLPHTTIQKIFFFFSFNIFSSIERGWCHSHPFPVPPCTRNPPILPRKSYSTLRTHVFYTLLFWVRFSSFVILLELALIDSLVFDQVEEDR